MQMHLFACHVTLSKIRMPSPGPGMGNDTAAVKMLSTGTWCLLDDIAQHKIHRRVIAPIFPEPDYSELANFDEQLLGPTGEFDNLWCAIWSLKCNGAVKWCEALQPFPDALQTPLMAFSPCSWGQCQLSQ